MLTNGSRLHAAFVKGINRITGGSLDPRKFLSAYFAYARVVEGLSDLIALDVTDTDQGPCRKASWSAGLSG